MATGCACGGSSGPRTRAGDESSHGHAALPARLAPQSASLSLTEGRSTAQYTIVAPSPARYAFDVSTDMPRSAALTIVLRTWYGAVLTAGEYRPDATSGSSTVNSESGCSAHGPRLTCVGHYPLLPAQKAGKWTVLVSKRSQAPASVRVGLTFYRPHEQ